MRSQLEEIEAALPPWTRELLGVLTPRRRAAFVLRESGLSLALVARRLDISIKAARQLYQAASHAVTFAARKAVLLHRYVPDADMYVRVDEPDRADTIDEASTEPRNVLDMPLDGLPLNIRAINCLEGAGIRAVGDLVTWTEVELLRISNMGRKTLRVIKRALDGVGLALRRPE